MDGDGSEVGAQVLARARQGLAAHRSSGSTEATVGEEQKGEGGIIISEKGQRSEISYLNNPRRRGSAEDQGEKKN